MHQTRQDIAIRKAGIHESDHVTAILADAFSQDPVMTWISKKPAYLEFVFGRSIPFFLPYGETYMAKDGSAATAWMPPGIDFDLPVTLSTFWHALRDFGFGSIGRMYKTTSMMTKYHPKEDHYYLFALGVRSVLQGKGIGSVIIRHILERCDKDRVAAYLENTNVKNIPFYERHGFKIIRELHLSSSGVKMWAMWREPV